MSLGRLLTSGKSLIGLRNTESRYHMRSRDVLPKFGTRANPFVTKKPESLAPTSAPKFQTVARTLTSNPAPAKEPAPVIRELKAAAISPRWDLLSVALGWIGRLNPLAWRTQRRSSPVRSVKIGFQKGQVQGELSLENIKVVRNDLSEADVAVVPVKTTVAPRPETVEPVVVPETAELIKS